MSGIPWWAYLVSTVITAIVSGGGVVLGQLLAARQAKASAQAQLALRERELEQAAHEKRLDARVHAYAKFIPAALSARVALLHWSIRLDGNDIEPLKSALADLEVAESLIILHGTEEVRSAAEEVSATLRGGDSKSYLDLRQNADTYEDEKKALTRRFWSALHSFQRLARADVQGEDADMVVPELSSASPSGAGHQGTDIETSSETQGESNGSRDRDEPGAPPGDRQ